jgi:hypothetical protein
MLSNFRGTSPLGEAARARYSVPSQIYASGTERPIERNSTVACGPEYDCGRQFSARRCTVTL